MQTYVIALEPEEKLCNLIKEKKELIKSRIGEQIYLSHPPHLTLFPITSEKLNQIMLGLENIKQTIKKFPITLTDFFIFYNDLQTKGHTIVCKLSQETTAYIKKIQIEMLNKINSLNTKEMFSIEDSYHQITSKIEKQNISNYGYPYIGENWIAHFTISSIDKNQFSEIWEELKQNPIQGNFIINSIVLYNYIPPEKPELIKRFNLN